MNPQKNPNGLPLKKTQNGWPEISPLQGKEGPLSTLNALTIYSLLSKSKQNKMLARSDFTPSYAQLIVLTTSTNH